MVFPGSATAMYAPADILLPKSNSRYPLLSRSASEVTNFSWTSTKTNNHRANSLEAQPSHKRSVSSHKSAFPSRKGRKGGEEMSGDKKPAINKGALNNAVMQLAKAGSSPREMYADMAQSPYLREINSMSWNERTTLENRERPGRTFYDEGQSPWAYTYIRKKQSGLGQYWFEKPGDSLLRMLPPCEHKILLSYKRA